MFLFAWSSVMLNLRGEVYTPVMSTFLEFKKQPERPPKTTDKPMLDWSQAYDIAVAAMDEVARAQGFTVNFPSHLFYNRRLRCIHLFRQHLARRDAGTRPDRRSDRRAQWHFPRDPDSDRRVWGDTVSRWLQSLHMAKVFGLPYRIFVAVFGIALAVSAYTGLYVWWKKRQARRAREARIRGTT